MRLRSIANPISESMLDTAGHAALDIVGFVPGLGEPADLANALWYAKKGDYFSAVLSLVSMIPDVGDVVGKGIKYLGKSSTFVAKFLAKNGDTIARYWPKVKQLIAKSKDWRPYARHLDAVVAQLRQHNVPTEPASGSVGVR